MYSTVRILGNFDVVEGSGDPISPVSNQTSALASFQSTVKYPADERAPVSSQAGAVTGSSS
jgi:hypothetical protein